MDKQIAKDLMAELLALSGPMDAIAQRIGLIEDAVEKSPMKRAIYSMMGDVYGN